MTMSDRIALMSDGGIEQLGTPEELYQKPATLTVARFIGTPSINLIPVEADASGNIALHGQKLGLRATKMASAPATLGIRSEDIFPAADGFDARILRTETQGADRYVTCALVDDRSIQLVMRLSTGDDLGPVVDGNLRISFVRSKAHLFGTDENRCETALCEQVPA
jgi:multiple sugar transport system ATP-binding protein